MSQSSYRMSPMQCRSFMRGFGLAAVLVLSACSDLQVEEREPVETVEGFAGLVVADEPRAATIGRDILIDGGNAADAAIAMYFAMTVTLPSRVGLGGGGTCVIYDNEDKRGDVLQFLPVATPSGGIVPRGPRAMAALSARQGRMRWPEMVSPAESLARFGHAVSRAFVRDLQLAASRIEVSPELSRLFRNKAGRLPAEGDRIEQVELAGVLSGLRSQGAGYLHGGSFLDRYVEASVAAGQLISRGEVRDALPVFEPAIAFPVAGRTAYFSGPPAADGLVAAMLWRTLTETLDYQDEEGAERAHLFVEAAMRSFGDRADWMNSRGGSRTDPGRLLDEDHLRRLADTIDRARHTPADALSPRPNMVPENPYGASLVAGDHWGNAAACSFTMNGLFGAFRTVPGTGIILAAPPSGDHNGALAPSAVIIAADPTGNAYFGAAASGGSAAPTALVAVLSGAVQEGRDLAQVVGEARIHHGGLPDVVSFEPGTDPGILAGLRQRGHDLSEVPELGRVNAFTCLEGLRNYKLDCDVVQDPRGFGLAITVQ
jgi:gamma-glutamyltranspeptidase/glutathione hydrolase